jgi:pimeloyl-ACP methyl ester carboxylesterase
MPEFRTVSLKDVNLRIAVEGRGPLVVFVHGFPESWYSWRHQIGPVAAAGFTACAIDVRGYGASDKPMAIESYSLQALSGDIAELIGILSPDRAAVVVGHDWGASIARTTALVHHDRVPRCLICAAWTFYPDVGIGPSRNGHKRSMNVY